MVSKVLEVVAVGLVPHSQGRVLAVPLPGVGSAFHWGFIFPPTGRRALAASAGSSSILPQGQTGSGRERRRDRLRPPLSLRAAKGVIDKQVSALKEKRCSVFEAASLINAPPWLSPLPTGFQMTAAGVIRALGSTVSEIITG